MEKMAVSYTHLDVYKRQAVDAAMDIGNYQGFNMRIQFDGWSKEFIPVSYTHLKTMK